MKYNVTKYKITETEQKREDGTPIRVIVASSTYAAKPVHGYAKCHAEDTFDMKKGAELAAARCNEKIAAKRVRRANRKLAEAEMMMKNLSRHLEKMESYSADAIREYNEAVAHRQHLEEIM